MRKGTCRGCGADIVWIETEAGKSMPCNSKMVPYWERPKAPGKVVLQNGKVISCDFAGERDAVTGFGYVSHFSTCPEAGKFRKR